MDARSTDAGRVVVGVDRSDCAREAAGWAADLAGVWGASLHLVHVVPQVPAVTGVPSWLGELLDATERTGTVAPRAEIIGGNPIEVLADRTTLARMLVLGSYGEGARSGMLAGSVALALVDRTSCPVAVVRGRAREVPPPRSGPVVVGVDGSRAGSAALQLAADLAASLGARLVAVHTWADVVVGIDGGIHRRPEVPALLEAEGAALLESELDGVEASYPGLPVERDLVGDTPVRALMDRARSARLLVVGHAGHGSGPGMLAGSTSRALVEFAPCPVMVIRPAAVPDELAPTSRSRSVGE